MKADWSKIPIGEVEVLCNLTSVFYRHGAPGYLALEQNNYEFRACFAIGNVARSPYSNTVSSGI